MLMKSYHLTLTSNDNDIPSTKQITKPFILVDQLRELASLI